MYRLGDETRRGAPPIIARVSGHLVKFLVTLHQVSPRDIFDIVHLIIDVVLGVTRGTHIPQSIWVARTEPI